MKVESKIKMTDARFTKIIYYTFLICGLCLPLVLPANILFFFPGGNVSHKTTVWPWVIEMGNRGHNVTFLSPHLKLPLAHPNVTDLTSTPLFNMVNEVYKVDRFKDREAGVDKVFNYNKIVADTCKVLIEERNTDPVLRTLFRDGSYDLIVVNAFFGECGLYVGHYFNAKMIQYSSTSFIPWFYDTYGVSPEAAWIPDLTYTFRNYPLTFWDRVYNNFYTYYWSLQRHNLSPMLEEITKPLFKPKDLPLPSLYELENNASLVLINSHVSVDFARTLPPLFVDIGGMAARASSKEMPKNFKEFMDESGPNGVILISFGSTILLSTIRARYQAMFFHLIHEFPHVRFIMRWSGTLPKFLDSQPKNLLVSEWLPQKEILAHPKLKVLITHGGVSSIHEATYHGVPMIVVPLFADQDYNAYRIDAQEIGVRVEVKGMTENSLLDAADKILRTNKFKRNMMKKRAFFHDKPLSAVDTAVFWTEFALRHDDTIGTFRPANQHLNWFQRRLLDVHLFYFSGILLLVVLLLVLLKFTLKCVFRKKCGQQTLKQNGHINHIEGKKTQ